MYVRFFKRPFDLIFSVLVLLITSPLLILTSALLLFQNRGNIFFFQKRPGWKEKPFYIIKFRTMSNEKDKNGDLLPDMDRITTVGKWVRKLSLDELPQMFNVVKGDMSVVGPRPLLFKYIPLYSESQRRRHEVKPGITGWAQINGRNSISWQKKFEYDVFYVDNVSFKFDLKIIFLTVLKVLKREGINQTVTRPMQPFDGTN